jgi:hypothetical protein
VPQPTLYRIRPGSRYDELAVEQVWTQGDSGPFGSGYRQIVPHTIGGNLYLLGFTAESGKADVLKVDGCEPSFTPVDARIDLGGPQDIIEPFVLGNIPHLVAYKAQHGDFSFIPLSADLASQPAYPYKRIREPGITAGFDVTQPIVVNGLVYILCYAFKTGNVNIYSLAVTATAQPGSAPGTPPLLAIPIWVHQWAAKWTRFAFFQMGAETFFFKTNVGKLNVNIDHVLDDPSQGTVEVGTYLELENALTIDIVRPFSLGGDPYFLTYMKDGTTTFNRFHGDCQGWTKGASLNTVTEASQIVPFTSGKDAFVLFY